MTGDSSTLVALLLLGFGMIYVHLERRLRR